MIRPDQTKAVRSINIQQAKTHLSRLIEDAVAGEVAVGLNAVILSDNVGHVISFEREHFEAIIAAYSEFTKREAER